MKKSKPASPVSPKLTKLLAQHRAACRKRDKIADALVKFIRQG